MDENRQNGHKDILLDRKQLDQVMRSISKQMSHKQYEYLDSGSLGVEVDELFSYEEVSSLLPRLTSHSSRPTSNTSWIDQLLNQLDSGYEQRIEAAKGLLTIALGEVGQWNGDKKRHMETFIKNNLLLYDKGVFHSIHQYLQQACNQLSLIGQNVKTVDSGEQLLVEIDLYLTINYLILETNRQQKRFENWQDLLEIDILEYLFVILSRLKDNFMQLFPVKKLLLLVWKVILATLGNVERTKHVKKAARKKYGLPPIDKAHIVKCSQQDLFNFQNDLLSRYPTYTPLPLKNNTIINEVSPLTMKATPALVNAMGISNATRQTTLPYQVLFPPKQSKGNDNKQPANNSNGTTNGLSSSSTSGCDDPWHSSQLIILPLSESGPSIPVSINEANSVYHEHLQLSLADYQIIVERQRAMQKWQETERNREKFTKDKSSTLSTSDTEKDRMNDIQNGDHTNDIFDTIERFYEAVVPELQGIVIVLLKQLLTTATTKSKSANLPVDSNQKQHQKQQHGSSQQGTTMEMADTDRNREILCKSISAILLLLLKWFKTSHVLKFEYLSQLLVDSGCMLLILKIFGLQEIGSLAGIKTDLEHLGFFQQAASFSSLDRPNESIYTSPPSSPMSTLLSSTETHYTNERNLFWIINLLRVLQMLSKKKVHRIMLLVQYKSSAIFKRVHKVSHPMVELYALKNLKNQIPYLGRKWRSVNMKMISAIYFSCPADLRDEWLITRNDKEADLEEGKMEEVNLRILVRLYHGRRYLPKLLPEDDCWSHDYTSDSNSFTRPLELDKYTAKEDADIFNINDLDDAFKKDYRYWLDKEVYNKTDQWKYDGLLDGQAYLSYDENDSNKYDTDNDGGDDDGEDCNDDDSGNQNGCGSREYTAGSTDWSIGTPIPASPLCRPTKSTLSPTALTREINKLYHEELNREFSLSNNPSGSSTLSDDEWSAPAILTNYIGERVLTEDEDGEEDNEPRSWLSDPLENVDWTNLSEEEFAKRLAIVEEKTVRRWMNVDIDDPQYLKVLNTFENVEDDPMNDTWGAIDPSLDTSWG